MKNILQRKLHTSGELVLPLSQTVPIEPIYLRYILLFIIYSFSRKFITSITKMLWMLFDCSHPKISLQNQTYTHAYCDMLTTQTDEDCLIRYSEYFIHPLLVIFNIRESNTFVICSQNKLNSFEDNIILQSLRCLTAHI